MRILVECLATAAAFAFGFWCGARAAGAGIAERLTKNEAVDLLIKIGK